ncbi:hypothetical protein B0H14DRAFT_3523217 [Mycena olivaceomarginata]|nr:hypothetical protein B0H14DRAFT_3523217 [Mycena olivaceomarginata]
MTEPVAVSTSFLPRASQPNSPCPGVTAHSKGNESGASKATKALEAAINKNKKIEYDLAIDEIFVERNQKIAELAARFNKDVNEVRATVCCVSRSKAHRKPTLRNGVGHQRSLDLQNQGITKSMKDLYAELDQELENGAFSYRSIDKVEEKRLVDQVLESRAHARHGPRATMKAAQIDARLTAKQIGDEEFVCSAFFAVGHADDPSRSHYVDSDDALDFFTQGLDMSAPHFMRKFEQWSCNLDEGKRVKNGSTVVRKDVSQLDYRSPPDGLMDGTIDFVPMTPAQVKELAAEQKAAGCRRRDVVGPELSAPTNTRSGARRKGKATAKSTGAGGKKSKAVGSEEDSSSEEEEEDDSSDEAASRAAHIPGQHAPLPRARASGASTQIDDMVLPPISSTTPAASTAALAPISSTHPRLPPPPRSHPYPTPHPRLFHHRARAHLQCHTAPASTALLPDPAPVFRIADAFVHDYGALQRNVGGEPFQPEDDETHIPPLPSTFSR